MSIFNRLQQHGHAATHQSADFYSAFNEGFYHSSSLDPSSGHASASSAGVSAPASPLLPPHEAPAGPLGFQQDDPLGAMWPLGLDPLLPPVEPPSALLPPQQLDPQTNPQHLQLLHLPPPDLLQAPAQVEPQQHNNSEQQQAPLPRGDSCFSVDAHVLGDLPNAQQQAVKEEEWGGQRGFYTAQQAQQQQQYYPPQQQEAPVTSYGAYGPSYAASATVGGGYYAHQQEQYSGAQQEAHRRPRKKVCRKKEVHQGEQWGSGSSAYAYSAASYGGVCGLPDALPPQQPPVEKPKRGRPKGSTNAARLKKQQDALLAAQVAAGLAPCPACHTYCRASCGMGVSSHSSAAPQAPQQQQQQWQQAHAAAYEPYGPPPTASSSDAYTHTSASTAHTNTHSTHYDHPSLASPSHHAVWSDSASTRSPASLRSGSGSHSSSHRSGGRHLGGHALSALPPSMTHTAPSHRSKRPAPPALPPLPAPQRATTLQRLAFGSDFKPPSRAASYVSAAPHIGLGGSLGQDQWFGEF